MNAEHYGRIEVISPVTYAYLFNHTTALLLNAYEMYVLMGITMLVFSPNILSHVRRTKSNNMDSLGGGEILLNQMKDLKI